MGFSQPWIVINCSMVIRCASRRRCLDHCVGISGYGICTTKPPNTFCLFDITLSVPLYDVLDEACSHNVCQYLKHSLCHQEQLDHVLGRPSDQRYTLESPSRPCSSKQRCVAVSVALRGLATWGHSPLSPKGEGHGQTRLTKRYSSTCLPTPAAPNRKPCKPIHRTPIP